MTKNEFKTTDKRTYVSLFSSAGVGCYGFKMEGFECVATNELLPTRLNIQKANDKCLNETGYISGDITTKEIQDKIFNEIKKWKKATGKDIDVVIATPPCQGMSTANYKKGNELNRNSLVVEAIEIVKKINPKIFIFENVAAFLKTMCVDVEEKYDTIENAINKHLGGKYNIYSKLINFKDYGVPSSRPRTLVVGTLKSIKNMSPLNIFPSTEPPINIRDVICDLPKLEWGEIDNKDLYHAFRVYPEYMRSWISNIKEGLSAFQNDDAHLPYKLVNGEKVPLKGAYLGNKFKRMEWDKPAPCIATRNDQLASQSTIHPTQDRVLSIRELMRVMSIPETFKWTEEKPDNNWTYEKKRKFLRKNALNIRRSIGEAVPTEIFRKMAQNIHTILDYVDYVDGNLKYDDKIKKNFYIESLIEERKIMNPHDTGSFYTPQSVVFDTLKKLKIEGLQDPINIIEPSVGCGAFIPQLISLIGDKKANIDLVDINKEILGKLEILLELIPFNRENIKFNFIHNDFLKEDFRKKKYDLLIGNPPFFKVGNSKLKEYRVKYDDKKLKNIFGFFMYKAIDIANEVCFVIPKVFLMTPEFNDLRKRIEEFNVVSIIDYGVKYFKDVFIEIISIHFANKENINYNSDIYIENKYDNVIEIKKNNYIFHDKIWILYRNEFFDNYIKTLKIGEFDFIRDRQITNKYLKDSGKIRVLRARNIRDDGTIEDKPGYDKYIDCVEQFQIGKYLNENCIIFPNFTYNTRATFLPENTIINGSIAILINLNNKKITKKDLEVFATDEFREYNSIVKNRSKFTINLDANSVYYLGVKK